MTELLTLSLALAVAFVPWLLLLLLKRALFLELLRDIRPGRILHYFILFLFGFVLYSVEFHRPLVVDLQTVTEMLLFLVALTDAALFAIVTNNVYDLNIDRISNPDRPLVKETIPQGLYMRIGFVSLLLSVVISALIGTHYLLAIVLLTAIYYGYSCPPFRLKRVVILAKLLIGINTLVTTCCGFMAAGGKMKEFPVFWLIFILGPVSLMANFVDLKDREGDRFAGIRTLPVLYGEGFTKGLLAVFVVAAYVMVLFYFDRLWIQAAVTGTCSIHLFLLFRKPYREKPLFILHNSLFLALTSLLLLQDVI